LCIQILMQRIRIFCLIAHTNRARLDSRFSTILISYGMIAFLVLAQIIMGCGLPQVILLDKPIRLYRVDASDSLEAPPLPPTVVAFAFPKNDADIIGYVIYYKVYYSSSTQDPDYWEDTKYFDENTYVGNNNEMQPGDAIPNQYGFLRIGEFGKSEFGDYDIRHNGSQKAVYIDFDPGGKGADGRDANLRNEPIIGYDYPVTEDNKIKVLARGFIDPTDTREATETYPGDKFRSFVNDWDYDDDDGDGYHDGDLRRGDYLLGNQPGQTLEHIRRSGEPFFQKSPPSQLSIRFVVHSYGRTKGNLLPLTSKPVYIGDITYSPVRDADRSRRS